MLTSSSDQEPSEPTEVPDILSMSQEQVDELVTTLQSKRMLTRQRYEEAERVKQTVRDAKTKAQMETCLMRMLKARDQIEKKVEAFEKDYARLMTLKRIAEIEEGDHDQSP